MDLLYILMSTFHTFGHASFIVSPFNASGKPRPALNGGNMNDAPSLVPPIAKSTLSSRNSLGFPGLPQSHVTHQHSPPILLIADVRNDTSCTQRNRLPARVERHKAKSAAPSGYEAIFAYPKMPRNIAARRCHHTTWHIG